MKDYHGHHFEYNIALANSAHAAGLETIIAANRQCEKDIRDEPGVLPWFQHDWYQSSSGAQPSQHFLDDLLDLLNTRSASADDIVLIHTVSASEFLSLLEYFKFLVWSEVAASPAFFVLLRRDPAELAPAELTEAREALRTALTCPDLDRKLILCTDTLELSAAWQKELDVPVRVMPIPFRYALMESQARPKPAGAPLSIVYLGDARTEKGYQHLPSVVQEMWPDFIQNGRVHFTLQSNYNLPGGESGIPNARLRLQHFPSGITMPTELASPEEYFAIMAAADIVVLPYDPVRYARRSSGVMNEALAGGKVAVAPVGSWMAAQAPPDQMVAYEHPHGLARAVIQAVEQFPALSAAARGRAEAYRARQNPDLFIQEMLNHVAAVAVPAGKSVLYVMDGDSMVNRTGAGSVARQQMEALIAFGFEVHAVFQRMHAEDDHTVAAIRGWMGQLRDEVRPLRLASVWATGYSPLYNHAGFQPEARVLPRRHTRLTADSDYRGSFAVPPALVRLLRVRPPIMAFVNYVQNLPFTRDLVGDAVPIICESVDIQAFQFGLRRGELDEAEFEAEIEALRMASQVIALNPIEAEHFAQHLGADRVTYIPPPPSATPVTAELLVGAADLAELLDTCGPSHPALLSGSGSALRGHFRDAPRIDLLYISSQHGPNLEGLRHFFHHVFYPLLAPQGVTIAVAGMICHDLKGLEGPQILLAHRLKDLAPLYAAARLVILPIFDGAGGAVKASEAIAFGKPVVATTFALRGMVGAGAQLGTYDDWGSFGDRILQLLNQPEERLAAARASLAVSRANNNVGLYRARLAHVVNTALGHAAVDGQQAGQAELAPAAAGLVEWQAGMGLFSRIARDFAASGYMAPELARRYRAEPLDGAMLEAARDALATDIGTTQAGQFLNQLNGRGDGDQNLSAAIHVPVDADARLIATDSGQQRKPIWSSGGVAPLDATQGWLAVPMKGEAPSALLEQLMSWDPADSKLRHPIAALSGMHKVEQLGMSGRYVRWTGPQAISELLIRVDRGADHEIAFDVIGCASSALFEQASLHVDGKPVPTLKWSKDTDRKLVALVPRDDGVRLRPTKIGIRLPATIRPQDGDPENGDGRFLGLLLSTVRVRTSRGAADVRMGALRFFQGCLEQLLARPKPDLVYGVYRDLLLREPDTEGFADNLKRVRIARDGGRDLIRVVMDSSEFQELYDNPALSRLMLEVLEQARVATPAA